MWPYLVILIAIIINKTTEVSSMVSSLLIFIVLCFQSILFLAHVSAERQAHGPLVLAHG
jgi:hypothetical protein